MSVLGIAAANGALNVIQSAISNEMAREREREARRENYKYGEMSAANADARTRALYADLQSPEALLKQYKRAGLSPSMMFGGAAVGGQLSQGAQGTGSAGITPTSYGLGPLDLAQLKLTNAQAEKEQAEADRISGKSERGRAEIDNLVADTQNKEVQAAFNEYKAARESIQLGIDAATAETKVKAYTYETEILMHRVKSAKAKGKIDEETAEDMITKIKEDAKKTAAEVIYLGTQNVLAKAGITLTRKQVEDLTSQINTREGELELSKDQLKEQVKQWGKENGYTEEGLNLKLAEIIADFAGGGIKTFETLWKIFGNKGRPIKGLQ